MKEYNPFNPNSVVSTNLFGGRREYILNIIGKLTQVRKSMPASFFLFGERGIGKTALAKFIKYIAEIKNPKLGNLNFLTSYYTVEKGQPISSVLQASLNELTDKMPQTLVSKLGSKLGSIFKNGKFSIGGFSLGVEVGLKDMDQAVVLKDQIVSILTNIIEGIKSNEDPENTKDGVLIVIDEMDNIADIKKCAQLFRGVITTLDVKSIGNISFLLIGYRKTAEEFYAGDTSARRQFDTIELGAMPLPEAVEVLKKGFNEAQISWDEAALLENIIVTGGYPHSIQMIGYNLIEVDTDKRIDEKDWGEAVNRTARELQHKDFADLYDFKGKPGIKELILDVLAIKGAYLTKKQLQSYTKKNIYQYIPELIKKGSLQEIKKLDAIRLHSQLFRTSILLHILPKIRHENYLKEIVNEVEKQSEPLQSSSSFSATTSTTTSVSSGD